MEFEVAFARRGVGDSVGGGFPAFDSVDGGGLLLFGVDLDGACGWVGGEFFDADGSGFEHGLFGDGVPLLYTEQGVEV